MEHSAAVEAARAAMERCARRVVAIRQHDRPSHAMDESTPAMLELREAVSRYAQALQAQRIPSDVAVGIVTALVAQIDVPADDRPRLRGLAFRWASER